MAGAAPQIEWYIARDGQQYGPLTDLEMQKFVELGHLRPTDLVWRHGFPDWRPAPAVFPAPIPPRTEPHPARPVHEPARQVHEPQRQQTARSSPSQQSYRSAEPASSAANPVAVSTPYDDDDDIDVEDDELHEERPRRGRLRIAVILILVALLGGAIWLGMDLIPSPAKLVSLIQAPSGGDTGSEGPAREPQQSPSSQSTGRTAGLDAELQRMPLWRLIKREFPDWYQERLQEAANLKSSGSDEATIARRLTEGVVALRRQYADQALAASPAALRTIAESFLNNLRHLSAQSVQACYSFISQGETSPQVLELMNSPEHAEQLQRQVIAVFEAVAEGRRSPQTHLPPRQTDYAALSQALTGRGWTDREIQLFSNPRALAQAPAEVVCRLVQDWFAAQLSISDEDVQSRLLIESLKPVVAG